MDRLKVRDAGLTRQVLERDRGICQCCGSIENLEVHHIQPVVFGGLATLENLITLCSECHRFAPNNPNDFLEYQKSGGNGWQKITGYLLFLEIEEHPEASIGEFWQILTNLRISRFEKHYKDIELKATPPKINKTAWLRKHTLELLNQNQDKWLTVSQIFEQVTQPEDWKFTKLNLSSILNKLHADGTLEKGEITQEKPVKILVTYRMKHG